MKNKPFEMCMLFDFYGEILTDKQKALFDLYYNDDLSLAEIAEHVGITRQGVRDGIVRAEHTLRDTEARLGLVARYGRNQATIQQLDGLVQEIQSVNARRGQDKTIAALCQQALTLTSQLSE